eukprot:349644-Chlamydomonas_euryale.AAC.7
MHARTYACTHVSTHHMCIQNLFDGSVCSTPLKLPPLKRRYDVMGCPAAGIASSPSSSLLFPPLWPDAFAFFMSLLLAMVNGLTRLLRDRRCARRSARISCEARAPKGGEGMCKTQPVVEAMVTEAQCDRRTIGAGAAEPHPPRVRMHTRPPHPHAHIPTARPNAHTPTPPACAHAHPTSACTYARRSPTPRLLARMSRPLREVTLSARPQASSPASNRPTETSRTQTPQAPNRPYTAATTSTPTAGSTRSGSKSTATGPARATRNERGGSQLEVRDGRWSIDT